MPTEIRCGRCLDEGRCLTGYAMDEEDYCDCPTGKFLSERTPVVTKELFPILFGYEANEVLKKARHAGNTRVVIGLPWDMIAPHEKQALRNHSQSLARLAERGGLSAQEAVDVLTDKPGSWKKSLTAEAELNQLVEAWLTTAKDS